MLYNLQTSQKVLLKMVNCFYNTVPTCSSERYRECYSSCKTSKKNPNKQQQEKKTGLKDCIWLLDLRTIVQGCFAKSNETHLK